MYLTSAIYMFFDRARIKHKIQRYRKQNIIIDDSALIYNETELGIYCDKGRILIGEKACIKGQLIIDRSGGEIIVGARSYVGGGTRIWASEKVLIGNNVMIAHNCNIFDNDTHPVDYKERREDANNIIFRALRENFDSLKKRVIVIDDDAWIGCCSILLKGVHIGEGAIVAAGSVVTRDVEPWTVVAGNPAVEVKKLRKET